MKGIEQASLALLAFSVFLLLLLAGGFALQWYTSHPPLLNVSPESKDYSYAQKMQEATSLEGLRKVCTFWAEREDQSNRFVTTLHNQYLSMIQQVVVWLAILGAAFTAGSVYIYWAARKMRRAEQIQALSP